MVYKDPYTMTRMAALGDNTLPPMARLIYGYLCGRAGNKCYCFPSQATIAEFFDITIRAVEKNISILKNSGYIDIRHREFTKGKHNIYFINDRLPLDDEERRKAILKVMDDLLNELIKKHQT